MKKTKKSKKNAVIRKVIAGILILSAVIVAAIPENHSGVAAAAYNNELLSYTNDSSLARNGEFQVLSGTEANKLKRPTNPNDIFYSYEIRKVNNLDTLVWKYEYFLPAGGINNIKVGVICGYNDAYSVDSLFLGGKLYTGYDLVKKSDYDSYWASVASNTIGFDDLGGNLPSPQKLNEVDVAMNRYFPGDSVYAEWKTRYQAKLAEYQASHESAPATFADLGMNNDIFTVALSSMASEQQKVYYCDQHSLKGYTLTMIENSAQGSQYIKSIDPNDPTQRVVETIPNENQIYVVTLNNAAEISGGASEYDDRKFRYLASQNIGAIGENAFKDTKKVNQMSIGDGITLIGDHAFENSFVRNIHFQSVTYIGNYVFKNCELLTQLNLIEVTENIGKEAFYGCSQLQTVNIPTSVKNIGFGAFANCQALKTLNFSDNLGCNLGEYSFYNCLNLEQVIFPDTYSFGFGKAAFAVEPGSGSSAKLKDFIFSENIKDYTSPTDPSFHGYTMEDCHGSHVSGLGDYMFANRDNLITVEMPKNYGSGTDSVVHLPINTFDQCRTLGLLRFGTSQNMFVYFDETLFEDVENKSLYVFGPQSKLSSSADSINNTTVANPRFSTWQCHSKVLDYVPYVYFDGLKDHYEVGSGDYRYELEINPDNTAKLISCDFIGSPKDIDELIIPGIVADYEIAEMQNGCLNNVKDYVINLVVPEDSLSVIDDSVFENAQKLKTVSLSDSVESIGDRAFASCPELTTVTIGKNITSVGDNAFYNTPKLEDVYWTKPDNYQLLSSVGTNAFFTGSSKLYFHGAAEHYYLPFEYAMDANYINADGVRICMVTDLPAEYSMIMDDVTNQITLIDYPLYYDLPSDLRSAYEGGSDLSPEQRDQLNATLYLDIPRVVESIDIKHYLADYAGNSNRKNWIYIDDTTSSNFYTSNGATKQAIFGDDNLAAAAGEELYSAGLFSGYFFDDTAINAMGDNAALYTRKGNDWIKSISMPGVKSVPDYCFDSCERLESVIIGNDCTEIGESAFINCSKLLSIGTNANPNYNFHNGILYENKPDGTMELNTCLPARGTNRTSQEIWVNTENDPNLANVSSMKEGAFSGCKYITKADFSDSTIATVPGQAFDGCETLTEIILPNTVRNIAADAFKDGAPSLDVTIPCDSQISDTAFDGDAMVTIWTYPDCPITAGYRASNNNEIYVRYLNSEYVIVFLNDDLTEYERITVPAGGNGFFPFTNPTPKLSANAGGTFKYWHFDNNGGIVNVTENRQAIAVFELPSVTPSGNSSGGNGSPSTLPSGASPLPSGASPVPSGGSTTAPSGAQATASPQATASTTPSSVPGAAQGTYVAEVENGAGGGTYAPGSVVTITAYAPSSGKEFDRWTTSNSDIGFADAGAVSTTFIMPTHDVKVTATYKTAGTSGSQSGNASANGNGGSVSGNGGTSGGTNGGSQTGTNVTVTTGTIDNNNKNLASATVSGSTDNFVLKITDSAAAYAEVENALRNTYGSDLSNIKFVGFDISLYDATGTRKIENYDGLAVTITLPIPDELVPYAGNNQAALAINGRLEPKTVRFTTIDGVPCMTFTATHFSPYTVYVDTSNLVSGVTDATPKTGDGIAPKWFLSLGLASLGAVLFLWKDKKRSRLTVG